MPHSRRPSAAEDQRSWVDGRHSLQCTGQQSKLPRQLYRLSLSGVDHVDRAAVPAVLDGKRYNAADAYEPLPELDVAAEIFEAWLRDSFEAGLGALPLTYATKALSMLNDGP
jgi:hypothetical protein